jgi:hypothetical protein
VQPTSRPAASRIGNIVDVLKVEGQCPHCGDASRQTPLTGVKRLTILDLEIYRCDSCGCGCIYDKSTGTTLTFATLYPRPRRKAAGARLA